MANIKDFYSKTSPITPTIYCVFRMHTQDILGNFPYKEGTITVVVGRTSIHFGQIQKRNSLKLLNIYVVVGTINFVRGSAINAICIAVIGRLVRSWCFGCKEEAATWKINLNRTELSCVWCWLPLSNIIYVENTLIWNIVIIEIVQQMVYPALMYTALL